MSITSGSTSPRISYQFREFMADDYAYHAEDWETIRDCLTGERAVRDKGTRYLPRLRGHDNPHDGHKRYLEYLQRAPFFNACSRTVDGLTGAIFRRPPAFGNTTPALRRQLGWENRLTREGDSFGTAARRVTQEVVSLGRFGLFLDRGPNPNDPLFVATYPAEHILNYSTRVIDGEVQPDLIVLFETIRRRDPSKPLAFTDEEQVRVLELDDNNEFFQWIYPNRQSTTVYPTRRGQRLNFIPFVFVGPQHLRPQIQKSPILDIARMNISHYRSYASLEHGRHFTAMPVYVAKYDAESTSAQDSIPVNERNQPTYYLDADSVWEMGADDDALILEYKGSGLQYLENALETKENQIQSLGGRLIASNRNAPAQSSAALELQSLGEASTLLGISENLSTAFTRVMHWWLWWDDLLSTDVIRDPEQAPNVKFTVNFKENQVTPRELRAMQALYREGIMPIDALWHSFREAGVLPTDMSLDRYKRLLEDPTQVPEAIDFAAPGPQPTPAQTNADPTGGGARGAGGSPNRGVTAPTPANGGRPANSPPGSGRTSPTRGS